MTQGLWFSGAKILAKLRGGLTLAIFDQYLTISKTVQDGDAVAMEG